MKGKDRDGSEFSARDQIERIQPQDLHTVTFEVRLPPSPEETRSVNPFFTRFARLSVTSKSRYTPSEGRRTSR